MIKADAGPEHPTQDLNCNFLEGNSIFAVNAT